MKRKQEPAAPATDKEPEPTGASERVYSFAREAALDKLAQSSGFASWKDFEDACLRVGGIIRRG